MYNFWISLNLPLINFEIELDLSWARYCLTSEIYRAVLNTDPVRYEMVATTNSATFQKNNARCYVAAVTLSVNYNIKFWKIWSKDLKEQFLGTNIDLK